MAQGAIVGWFQGQAEFGPRALGHRSILADPRPADMKDRINERVKFREEFRPFAPAILEEHGLIDQSECEFIYDQLEADPDTEGVTLPFVRRAYFEYYNPSKYLN